MYRARRFDYKHIELSFVEIINILKKDKISLNWDVCFAILEDIGKVNIIDDLPYDIIENGFKEVFTIK